MIEATEFRITGQWFTKDGQIVADETCGRIEALIRTHLKELGRDSSGWDTLYRDPNDGRLWEHCHPTSNLHGGGPPELKCLSAEEVALKYRHIGDRS